ncbi:MAG TPA: hypothetical protein VMT54_03480 [Candidatus Cybelea sp.]|nr:hypothetical protein [Candidatus Cybelea sp.]
MELSNIYGRCFAAAALIAVAFVSARAEPLRGGDAFISAMQGNTLNGKAADGTQFKVYFLPGGGVTLQRGSRQPEHGNWRVDDAGDICVAWEKGVSADAGCFRVDVSGSKVTWSNKDLSHSGGLLGGVFPLDMQKAQ